MAIDSVEKSRSRAGFWRRILALLIDMAIILIPLQIVVAILYAQTNGAIQGEFGIKTTICSPLEKLPDGLLPTPPDGFNSIADCRTSILGFDTGRILVVAKTTVKGTATASIFQTYTLGADGKPRTDVFDVSWIALLLLLAYIVYMEYLSGATFGKRTLGIRVISVGYPDRVGIPFGKAILRQLAMWIGTVPILIVQVALFAFVREASELEAIVAAPYYFPLVIVAGLIALAWIIWIFVSLARKHDPIYDRLAGTAVMMK
jgi:uncharacterized RDD family membrane protein YckC